MYDEEAGSHLEDTLSDMEGIDGLTRRLYCYAEDEAEVDGSRSCGRPLNEVFTTVIYELTDKGRLIIPGSGEEGKAF